jgi:hypothetical protein
VLPQVKTKYLDFSMEQLQNHAGHYQKEIEVLGYEEPVFCRIFCNPHAGARTSQNHPFKAPDIEK